ncbi:hypothetical protein HN51_057419 [Arachis hypogaea]
MGKPTGKKKDHESPKAKEAKVPAINKTMDRSASKALDDDTAMIVLNWEPNNLTAFEIQDSLRITMEEKGITIDETEIALATIAEPPVARLRKVVREKLKKKKGHHQKSDEKMEEDKEVVHKEVVQTDHVQENVKSHVKEEDKEVVKHTTEKHNLEARPVKWRETAVTRTVK